MHFALYETSVTGSYANMSPRPDLPWSLPGSNEIVNDASPAKKPKVSPPHLPLMLEVLAPLVPRLALFPSQASSNKERSGNVPTVAKWVISRRTKSVPPDSFLIISLLFLPPLQERGNLLQLLQYRGRGMGVLLTRSSPTPMVTGQILDELDSMTGGLACSAHRILAGNTPCWTRELSLLDYGPFFSSCHPLTFCWLPLFSPFNPSSRVKSSQLNYGTRAS